MAMYLQTAVGDTWYNVHTPQVNAKIPPEDQTPAYFIRPLNSERALSKQHGRKNRNVGVVFDRRI